MRWMNLEPNIQSEVSQKVKNKYRILAHMHGEGSGTPTPALLPGCRFNPWVGKILEKEVATHSNILPGNPIDRRAWWATVHEVSKRVGHDLVAKQQLCYLINIA